MSQDDNYPKTLKYTAAFAAAVGISWAMVSCRDKGVQSDIDTRKGRIEELKIHERSRKQCFDTLSKNHTPDTKMVYEVNYKHDTLCYLEPKAP